jgi:polyisoprenoid-binding protein YceI
MQEHFNENYIESEKYPKSTFKGTITDFLKIPENVATKTQVKGTMTIHGVSREVVIPSTITKKEGEIVMDGKFIIKLEDYKIKIPKIVIKNIAEEIEVTYKLNHLPYN